MAQPTLEQFADIVDRLGLTEVETAAIVGVSPTTIRIVRMAGELPVRERCRRAIAEFVRINKRAKRRTDLKLVDREVCV